MRLRQWAAAAAMASVALLSACGGGGSSSSNADIRLVNASAGYASLDLQVDSKAANSGVAYGTAGSYSSMSSGTTAQILSGGTTLASTTPTLTGGNKYSLIAYGWAGAARTTLLQEAETAPAAGSTKLLVLNLAPDAGALDIYLTNSTDTLESATAIASSIAGGAGSGYNTTTAGTYRVRITGAGRKDDLRLDIPSVELPSLQVATLIITPTTGGVLVNAMTLVQTAAVKTYSGTNARIRVIGALGTGSKVAATRGTTSLLVNSATPTIGEYSAVASGNTAVNVFVNDVAQAATTPALAVGGDYTLLVWGTAAAPQISLITDDNRLPTTTGQAKIRLINGVSNLPGGLRMTADFVTVANNVAAGTASTFTTVTATTGAQLAVTSPEYSDTLFPPASQTTLLTPFVAGGIYNVFMMGDGSTLAGIKGMFSRER